MDVASTMAANRVAPPNAARELLATTKATAFTFIGAFTRFAAWRHVFGSPVWPDEHLPTAAGDGHRA